MKQQLDPVPKVPADGPKYCRKPRYREHPAYDLALKLGIRNLFLGIIFGVFLHLVMDSSYLCRHRYHSIFHCAHGPEHGTQLNHSRGMFPAELLVTIGHLSRPSLEGASVKCNDYSAPSEVQMGYTATLPDGRITETYPAGVVLYPLGNVVPSTPAPDPFATTTGT